jgi:hypothetical protein
VAETGLNRPKKSDKLSVRRDFNSDNQHLPKDSTLAPSPLTVTCAAKQWKNACTKAAQLRANGTPALLIVEAHVGAQGSSLVGIVKGIQVVEGKAPTAAPVG